MIPEGEKNEQGNSLRMTLLFAKKALERDGIL